MVARHRHGRRNRTPYQHPQAVHPAILTPSPAEAPQYGSAVPAHSSRRNGPVLPASRNVRGIWFAAPGSSPRHGRSDDDVDTDHRLRRPRRRAAGHLVPQGPRGQGREEPASTSTCRSAAAVASQGIFAGHV